MNDHFLVPEKIQPLTQILIQGPMELKVVQEPSKEVAVAVFVFVFVFEKEAVEVEPFSSFLEAQPVPQHLAFRH